MANVNLDGFYVGRRRLVVLKGVTSLALDIAKQKGSPVSVVGPNAADCPECGAKDGLPCKAKFNNVAGHPHLGRVMAMGREMDRLREEDKAKAKVDAGRHNHMTRDIKPEGQCPACDRYHKSK